MQAGRPLTDPLLDHVEVIREAGLNLIAPALLVQAVLPAMLARGRGWIVNMSSGLAVFPKEDTALYCATKAGLSSLTTSLRWQVEGRGMAVAEVMLPLVDTPMTAGRGSGKLCALCLWLRCRRGAFRLYRRCRRGGEQPRRPAPGDPDRNRHQYWPACCMEAGNRTSRLRKAKVAFTPSVKRPCRWRGAGASYHQEVRLTRPYSPPRYSGRTGESRALPTTGAGAFLPDKEI